MLEITPTREFNRHLERLDTMPQLDAAHQVAYEGVERTGKFPHSVAYTKWSDAYRAAHSLMATVSQRMKDGVRSNPAFEHDPRKDRVLAKRFISEKEKRDSVLKLITSAQRAERIDNAFKIITTAAPKQPTRDR